MREYENLNNDMKKLRGQKEEVITKFNHLTEELLDPASEQEAINTATALKDDIMSKIKDTLDCIHATSLVWFEELRKRSTSREDPGAGASTCQNIPVDGSFRDFLSFRPVLLHVKDCLPEISRKSLIAEARAY